LWNQLCPNDYDEDDDDDYDDDETISCQHMKRYLCTADANWTRWQTLNKQSQSDSH